MSKTEKFEQAVEQWGKSVEEGLPRWIQRDRAFNFLRTTRARVILWIVTYSWTFLGFAVVALRRPQWVWYWMAGVFICYLLQRVSVRDLFHMPHLLLDELQVAKRNKAYRRAYRNFGAWVVGLMAAYAFLSIWGVWQWHTSNQVGWLNDHLRMQAGVSVWFLIPALWFLAPYLATGFKGERED
jgi:hypothetical protein